MTNKVYSQRCDSKDNTIQIPNIASCWKMRFKLVFCSESHEFLRWIRCCVTRRRSKRSKCANNSSKFELIKVLISSSYELAETTTFMPLGRCQYSSGTPMSTWFRRIWLKMRCNQFSHVATFYSNIKNKLHYLTLCGIYLSVRHVGIGVFLTSYAHR